MANSAEKGRWVWLIGAIGIVYLLTFGYLYMFEGADWPLKGFFDSLIGVFMGAGAIGIITSILFIFQAKIQSEHAKQKSVFEQKMALYQSIIADFESYLEDSEISKEEERSLFFTQLKVFLLSSPKTLEAYSQLISNLRDDDGEISQDIGQSLLLFIEEAREDLDVQEQMSYNERASFNSALEIARKEASRSVSGKRSFDVEYKSKILSELDSAKRGESKRILDREGLYYSQVSSWRKMRDQGKLVD